jgi:CarD family transcriptional regulator
LSYLATGACISSSDWKVRFKANSEKMLGGSLLHAAEVFKNLLELQKDKLLSFREKKMMDRARHMLVTEISIARAIREPEALVLLQRYLDKAGLTLPPVL